MEKYLVTMEFRYTIKAKTEEENGKYKTQTITIGVYETLDDAIKGGNTQLEVFEKYFKLNPNWNRKERFSKNGGCFGSANTLVSPLTWLYNCPFDFYAKITTLNFSDTEETIIGILKDLK